AQQPCTGSRGYSAKNSLTSTELPDSKSDCILHLTASLKNSTMSHKGSSDSSSSDAPPATPTPLCIICDQAAVGVAPFSRCHMCSQHLSVDVANLFKLKYEVEELLRAYSQESQVTRVTRISKAQQVQLCSAAESAAATKTRR
uniref:Beclin 1-associated autophagy-related key regulator n=1 Tax=Macrostomum lignano TaxID=282301 RepID=A0A1I8H8J8_9PLAT